MGAQAARFVDSGNEWATPWWVVNQAAGLLGIRGFDLDVAATAANAKAPRFFTREDNALQMKWYGNVWLNSPFSRPEQVCSDPCRRKRCVERGRHVLRAIHGSADFAKVAVDQLRLGNVESIAWHGPVATDTKWFRDLWDWTHERIDYTGRIRYNDSPSGGTFPSQTLILRSRKRTTPWVPTYLQEPPKGAVLPEVSALEGLAQLKAAGACICMDWVGFTDCPVHGENGVPNDL